MPPYIIRARDTFVLVERTSETDRRGKEEEGGEQKKKKWMEIVQEANYRLFRRADDERASLFFAIPRSFEKRDVYYETRRYSAILRR